MLQAPHSRPAPPSVPIQAPSPPLPNSFPFTKHPNPVPLSRVPTDDARPCGHAHPRGYSPSRTPPAPTLLWGTAFLAPTPCMRASPLLAAATRPSPLTTGHWRRRTQQRLPSAPPPRLPVPTAGLRLWRCGGQHVDGLPPCWPHGWVALPDKGIGAACSSTGEMSSPASGLAAVSASAWLLDLGARLFVL